jgi:hypothetical protein
MFISEGSLGKILAMDCIRSFELKQMSLNFKFCTICKERRIETKMSRESGENFSRFVYLLWKGHTMTSRCYSAMLKHMYVYAWWNSAYQLLLNYTQIWKFRRDTRLKSRPVDGELTSVQTVEFNPDTVHNSDLGPAPNQTDPGEINGTTHSSVLLLRTE